MDYSLGFSGVNGKSRCSRYFFRHESDVSSDKCPKSLFTLLFSARERRIERLLSAQHELGRDDGENLAFQDVNEKTTIGQFICI